MYHDFVENWLSHSTEKFRTGFLQFSEKFFYRKFLWQGGISRLSLETFLSHTTEKIPSVTLLFEKLSGLKKMHKMVYHDFVENWFSHSTEKFRTGFLQFSEKFFYRKFLWLVGGYHDFLSKLLCLTLHKKLLGGPFFPEKFCIK